MVYFSVAFWMRSDPFQKGRESTNLASSKFIVFPFNRKVGKLNWKFQFIVRLVLFIKKVII